MARTSGRGHVGAYQLLRLLGRGGMGEVWLAERPSIAGIAKPVALKLLSGIDGSESAHRRFLDEARLSLLLAHSNIVQVFDVGISDGVGYIAMEFVDGIDLAQLMERQRKSGTPWPPAMVAFIVGEILRGLDYAHGMMHAEQPLRLVHRDISPHNVLVSRAGELKLTDFGIARTVLAHATDLRGAGKWKYMAPEQVAGHTVEQTADLFAVGVILHELLTNAPYRCERADLVAREVPGLPQDVPDVLRELHRRLLEPDPGRRIRHARVAMQAIEDWHGYRRASHALAAKVELMQPAVHGSASVDASTSPDATEAATGTATATTHTAFVRRSPGRAKVVIGIAAWATVALAGASVAVWHRFGGTAHSDASADGPARPQPEITTRAIETTSPRVGDVRRGPPVPDRVAPTEPPAPDFSAWGSGCLVDRSGTGKLEVFGILQGRDLTGPKQIVSIDIDTGAILRRIDGRPELSSFICRTPNWVIVSNHDQRKEDWGFGRWDRPWTPDEAPDGPPGFEQERLRLGAFARSHRFHIGPASIDDWEVTTDDYGIIAKLGNRWTRRLPGEVDKLMMAMSGKLLFVAAAPRVDGEPKASKLDALDASTGAVRFEIDLGRDTRRPRGRLLLVERGVLITDFGDRLRGIDPSDGKVLWSVPE